MKRRALILGLIALASVARMSAAQGKGGGTNSTKVDAVTGINIVLLDRGDGTPMAPQITWNAIDKATYQVQRSKAGDSCCNNASASGLTAASWQDSPLPSSGAYVYRVTATLRSGQVVGLAQFPYTAPTTSAPAPAPAPSQPALLPSGRYRISIRSIEVVTPTTDDATMRDGVGDEIYAAGVVARVDRNTGVKLGATVVRSKEYGDIGNNGSTYPNRIRAGTASPDGGLNGGSSVGQPGTPGAETFPFVLWEGTLTGGGEAVVVLPSVWERDTADFIWRDYSSNWMSSSAPLLGSQLLKNLYSSNTLTPVVASAETGAIQQGVTGPIYGNYVIGSTWVSGADRMIGMVNGNGLPIYSERILVLTRENLDGMVVGGVADLNVSLNENITGGGLYTVILRIERIG